ncbi:unnamed protein product [Gulo gulo]|uniref:Uncharacterized protein n=1 Tax=Gulo gulo TaxID=48420 RepID=A0A9X9LV09_GULGU|nr:unnamed protein product [Gulo gulo]
MIAVITLMRMTVYLNSSVTLKTEFVTGNKIQKMTLIGPGSAVQLRHLIQGP